MCVSFYIDTGEMSGLILKARKMQLARDMAVALGKSLTMDGDLYPANIAAVIAPNRNGRMSVFPMLWGFTDKAVPKPLVNCRIETAGQKPLWRESWYKRRCAVPVSWYYEWGCPESGNGSRSKKVRYAVQPEGVSTAFIAGLYRFEEHRGMKIPVFSVLTREAAGTVKDLHDRMPVILDMSCLCEWIRPDSAPDRIAAKALTDMVSEEAVEYHRSATDFISI